MKYGAAKQHVAFDRHLENLYFLFSPTRLPRIRYIHPNNIPVTGLNLNYLQCKTT